MLINLALADTVTHEHNKIIAMADNAKELHSSNQVSKAIIAVKDLVDFIEEHFNHEALLMKGTEYFDYQDHIRTHHIFIKMAKNLLVEIDKDNSFFPDAIRILSNWIKTHIEVETILFTNHINNVH